MIVKGTADQFSPDKHLFSCIFMLLLKMCVCRKNCINYLFSKSVEWIYFMMIIITCLMPQCSASQLWIGLAVHVHVLPRQLGIGRICSSRFAGSKVSPLFQASVNREDFLLWFISGWKAPGNCRAWLRMQGRDLFQQSLGVSDGQTVAGVLRVMDCTCLEEGRENQYFPKMRMWGTWVLKRW